MYIIIILFPLIGSILSGLLGRKLGTTGSNIIIIFCLFSSTILSYISFYEILLKGSSIHLNLFSWVNIELLQINWGLLFDSLSISIISIILTVSLAVHIYSIGYIGEDPHSQRFISYLSLFTFSILLLVSADNYLVIFVGWEGIGFVSYLLISFWFTRVQANKAAIQAITVNKVGDVSLILCFSIIIWICGSLDYSIVFSLIPYINNNLLNILGMLLLIGAGAKSALIFLHAWLPNSIEGPTPVSSLLHAATLVAAGAYLLLRSSPLLEFTPITLIVITIAGSFTSFFAASIGIFSNDLKRIIAFSTISQIGYVFAAIGLSQYNTALFHLTGHAFFKALLFLSAGGIIHSIKDDQDIRKYGGLIKLLPFTYTVIFIGTLSLIAIPFISGFYSKDLILELSYGIYKFNGYLVYWLGTITAIFTAFYSFRLISLTFITYPNANKKAYETIHEQPIIIYLPLIFLALFAIYFGYITRDIYVGLGSDIFSTSLFIHPSNNINIDSEFSIPLFYKLLPLIVTIIGSFIGLYLYNYQNIFINEIISLKWVKKIYSIINQKYYYDTIINKYIIGVGLNIGLITSKVLDKGLIEYLGPNGLANFFHNISFFLFKWDTGIIIDIALYIILSIILLLFIYFIPIKYINFNYFEIKFLFIAITSLFLSLNYNK